MCAVSGYFQVFVYFHRWSSSHEQHYKETLLTDSSAFQNGNTQLKLPTQHGNSCTHGGPCVPSGSDSGPYCSMPELFSNPHAPASFLRNSGSSRNQWLADLSPTHSTRTWLGWTERFGTQEATEWEITPETTSTLQRILVCNFLYFYSLMNSQFTTDRRNEPPPLTCPVFRSVSTACLWVAPSKLIPLTESTRSPTNKWWILWEKLIRTSVKHTWHTETFKSQLTKAVTEGNPLSPLFSEQRELCNSTNLG